MMVAAAVASLNFGGRNRAVLQAWIQGYLSFRRSLLLTTY